MSLLKSGKEKIDNVPGKVMGFLSKFNPSDKKLEQQNSDKMQADEDVVKGKFINVKPHDRVAQDLVSEVERFIRDREVTLLSNIEMKDSLEHLEDKVEKLLQEKDKLLYQFIDKEEEIKQLNEKINEKKAVNELLLKEYKELQTITSDEIRELKSDIEIEKHKYVQLTEDYKSYRSTANQDNDQLKEKIRKLEAKNEDLAEQYKVKTDENAELMQSINQFSEQFTFNTLKKKAQEQAAAGVTPDPDPNELNESSKPDEDLIDDSK